MRIYSMNILSVSLSVRLQKVEIKKHDFSRRLYTIEIWFFFVKIRLIDAHLFYECFVRQSTKGRNVKIKKHDFLSVYMR